MAVNSAKIAYAYCAGLVDGEGCICVAKNMHPIKGTIGNNQFHKIKSNGVVYRPYYSLWLLLSQKDIRPVDYMVGIFGGSILRRPTSQGWRIFQWTLAANQALKAIKKMLPYFKLKQDQAQIAIRFQQHMNRHRKDYKNREGYRHSEKIIAYRENLYQQLKKIKRVYAGAETKPTTVEKQN